MRGEVSGCGYHLMIHGGEFVVRLRIGRVKAHTLRETVVGGNGVASTEARHPLAHGLVDERVGVGHPHLREG